MDIKCNNCGDLQNQFGNFVFCLFLQKFVDFEYWTNICPEDCPKLNNKRNFSGLEELT